MPSEVSVKVLRAISELQEIRPHWESWPGHRDSDIDLFSTVAASNPGTLRPHVIVAYRDGRPDAILIGRIDLTTFPIRIGYWQLPAPRVRLLVFVIGAQRGNSSPDVSEVLLREALNSLRRGEADLGRLDFLRVDTPLYRLARTLPGMLERDYGAVPNPHWYMELSKTYEEVLKGLSSDFRWQIKRKAKGIHAGFSSVAVKCYEDRDELETMMRDVESIAVKSYQRGLGVGFHNSEVMRQGLQLEANKGWLLAYVLYLEGKPSAFWVGPLYDHIFYSDFVGFDPAYSKHSPGTYLQTKVLEDLCARGAKGIDFGAGDARYKAQLGTNCHQEASLYLYPATVRGVALNFLRTLTTLANQTLKAVASRANLLPRIKKAWRGKNGAAAGPRVATPTRPVPGGPR